MTQRVDLHFLAVEDLLNELLEVATTWDHLPESEQAAWSLDWDQAMARLRLLNRAARAGEMRPGQRQRYRALVEHLRQALPALEQLNLQRPPVLDEPLVARHLESAGPERLGHRTFRRPSQEQR